MSRLMLCGIVSWVALGCSRAPEPASTPAPGPEERKLDEQLINGPDEAENEAVRYLLRRGAAVERDEGAVERPVVKVEGLFYLGDTNVEKLLPLKNLVELEISDNLLTEVGLKQLASFKRLAKLKLGINKGVTPNDPAGFTPAGLRHIASLGSLTHLTIVCPSVTDAGLKELAPLTGLTSLNLGAEVTDAGLKEIVRFSNLTELTLFNTKVTDAGMRELAALKNLTTLLIEVTDRTLAVLREINMLHVLDGAKAPNGNRPAKPEDVTSLDLGGAKGVTDAGVKELAALKNLTTLKLFRATVTDTSVKVLVTDAGVKELQKALPMTLPGPGE